MKNAIFNISGMPVGSKLTWCRNIIDKMTTNALLFPNPPVSVADFTTHVDALEAKQGLMPYGGRTATMERDSALTVVNTDLALLRTYVNMVAQGNVTVITRSGFPVSRTPQPSEPTPRVVIRKVKAGAHPGELAVSCLAVPRSRYFVEVSEADENGNITIWISTGEYGRRIFIIPGLIPVKKYWVRVRAFGASGFGPWSDPYLASTGV
jgi:hypothetical protein